MVSPIILPVHFLASSRTIMDFEKFRAYARQEFEKMLDNVEQGLVREAEEKKVQVKTDVVLPRLKPPPKPRHRSYLEDSPPPLPKRFSSLRSRPTSSFYPSTSIEKPDQDDQPDFRSSTGVSSLLSALTFWKKRGEKQIKFEPKLVRGSSRVEETLDEEPIYATVLKKH